MLATRSPRLSAPGRCARRMRSWSPSRRRGEAVSWRAASPSRMVLLTPSTRSQPQPSLMVTLHPTRPGWWPQKGSSDLWCCCVTAITRVDLHVHSSHHSSVWAGLGSMPWSRQIVRRYLLCPGHLPLVTALFEQNSQQQSVHLNKETTCCLSSQFMSSARPFG